jgi:hypothetical protein
MLAYLVLMPGEYPLIDTSMKSIVVTIDDAAKPAPPVEQRKPQGTNDVTGQLSGW